jgi:hypothetical protein
MSTPALNSEKTLYPSSPCPTYSLPTPHYVPEENNGYDQYIRMIQQVYRTKIKPLEMNYNFEGMFYFILLLILFFNNVFKMVGFFFFFFFFLQGSIHLR